MNFDFDGNPVPDSLNSGSMVKKGLHRWSDLKIRPDVYVINPYTGLPIELAKLLETTNLPIRGVEGEDGIVWSGVKHIIEELNRNVGIDKAYRNDVLWTRASKVYVQNMSFKISQEKAKANMVKLFDEVQKQLGKNEATKGLKFKVGVGYNMNLVDPFMPIDPEVLARQWNVDDFSKFKVFSTMHNVHGDSHAYVGNTMLSYMRIQDVDTDALHSLQIEALDESGKVALRWMYDIKFPHTSMQKGSFVAKDYDPNVKYRKIRGVSTPRLETLLTDAKELAEVKSLKTFGNPKMLAQMIERNMKRDLTGILTSNTWVAEDLSMEQLIRNLPNILVEGYQFTPEQAQTAVSKLREDPASLALFKSRANTSIRGKYKKAVESIQKVRDLGDFSKLDGTVLEDLMLEVTLDVRDKMIMFPKRAGEFSASEKMEYVRAMHQATDYERMLLQAGLKTPSFKQGTAFTRKFAPRDPVKVIFDAEGKLSEIGQSRVSRTSILDSLMEKVLRNPITGNPEALLDIQFVDYSKTILKDLGQLPEGTGKGYFITMKNFEIDEYGSFITKPKPIAGAAPGYNSGLEKAHFVPFRLEEGKVIDPITHIKEELERQIAEHIPEHHPMRQYGIGELTGSYSIDNLRLAKGAKYVKKLAQAGNVTENHVRNLLSIGDAESILKLKALKRSVDLANFGEITNTTGGDVRRLLIKILGSEGVETNVRRNAFGKVIAVSQHQAEELSQLVTVGVAQEGLDYEVLANRLAAMAEKHPFIPYARPTSNSRSYLARRAIVSENEYRPLLSPEGTFWTPKRTGKLLGTSHSSVEIGKVKLGLIDLEFSDEMRKTFEGAVGDKEKFQAVDMTEGQMYITSAGFEQMKNAVYENMDISPTRQGEYIKPFKWKAPDGRTIKGYIKPGAEPETWRLLHDKLGNFRIVPWVMPESRAEATIAGQQHELFGFISIGELLSKDGGLEKLRIMAEQQGEEATKAFKAYEASNFADLERKNFVEALRKDTVKYGFKPINGDVEQYTQNMHTFDLELFGRNTEGDAKQNLITWAKKFSSIEGLPAFEMRGRALQEGLPEYAIGLTEMLNNLAPDANFSEEGIMGILLKGLEKGQAWSTEERQTVWTARQIMKSRGIEDFNIPSFYSRASAEQNEQVLNIGTKNLEAIKRLGFQQAISEAHLGQAIDLFTSFLPKLM